MSFNISQTDNQLWQAEIYMQKVLSCVSVKTEFDIAFRLSLLETICMKCQAVFPIKSEISMFASVACSILKVDVYLHIHFKAFFVNLICQVFHHKLTFMR